MKIDHEKERRLVVACLDRLEAAGRRVVSVYNEDTGAWDRMDRHKALLLYADLDECFMGFSGSERIHGEDYSLEIGGAGWVRFVRGNDDDVVADCSISVREHAHPPDDDETDPDPVDQESFNRATHQHDPSEDMYPCTLTDRVAECELFINSVKPWVWIITVVLVLVCLILSFMLIRGDDVRAASHIDRTAEMILVSERLTTDEKRAAIESLAVLLSEIREGGGAR